MQMRGRQLVRLFRVAFLAAATLSFASGLILAQGLQGDVNATFGPPVQSGAPEQPPQPPEGGISCAEAQQRYVNVIAHLNDAHARNASAEVSAWNQNRVDLEQYMTYRLQNCALPSVAMAAPPAA